MAWIQTQMAKLRARKTINAGRKIFKKTNPRYESPGVAEPGQHPATRHLLTKHIYSIAFKGEAKKMSAVFNELEATFEQDRYAAIDKHVAQLAKKLGKERAQKTMIQLLKRALKRLQKHSATFKVADKRFERVKKTNPKRAAELKAIRSGLSNTQSGIENYIQLALDHLQPQQ